MKSKREGTPDEASSPSKEAKKKPGPNRVKLRITEIQRVQAGDAKCNPQLSGITQVTTKLINNTMLVNKS